MYRRALVPLDGSLVAESIVRLILQIAGPLDMEVVLLGVVVPVRPTVIDAGPVLVDDTDSLVAEVHAYLTPIADRLRASGVRVTTVVRRGDAVTEILAGAREAQADVIIMTTHGRTGFGRLFFGSVAEGVLRRADVPVFMMRQTPMQLAAQLAEEGPVTRATG